MANDELWPDKETADYYYELARDSESLRTDAAIASGELKQLFILKEEQIVSIIKEQRIASGLSQLELAERMAEFGFSMNQTTIAKLESGKRPLRVAELFAMTQAMSIPVASALTHRESSLQGAPDDAIAFLEQRVADYQNHAEEMKTMYLANLDGLAKTYADFESKASWHASEIRRMSAQAVRDAEADAKRRKDQYDARRSDSAQGKNAAKYDLFQDKGMYWRFNLVDDDGRVIATSEAYEAREAAMQGIEAVRNAAHTVRVSN